MLAFRLQMGLSKHGVQLPCEFTLLMKTGCFGALYFSLLDEVHRDMLCTQLAFSGASYALSHPWESSCILSSKTLHAFGKLLWAKKRAKLVPGTRALACATTASIPLALMALQYL